jgi:(2Fe-2S) ferredoxin
MNVTDYYERHVFFCLNERAEGAGCCTRQGAQAAFDHCRRRIREEGLGGPGGVRINAAGCLDRCSGAPVAVVYPDAVWYTFVDEADIDEIVDSHIKAGRVVDRLLLAPDIGR